MFYFYLSEEDTSSEEIDTVYENSEYDTFDNIQNSANNDACTLVYTEDYQQVCAEDLISEDTVQVEIVESEDTKNANAEKEKLLQDTLADIKTNTKTLADASDNTIALDLSESIHNELIDIHQYLDIFIGLYIIGWVLSVVASWRRSIR